MTTTTRILELPWRTPPLTDNERLHWRQRAALVRDIRTRTAWLARAAKLPRDATHVTVGLHYQQPNWIRRDAGNLMGTHKPALDGLVDYGLIPDDTGRYVTERMPVLHDPVKGEPGRLWLEITWGETKEAP